MTSEVPRLPVCRRDLSRSLAEFLDVSVRSLRVEALGESSRETPWRVDLETAAGGRSVLVRFGESCSANEVAALEAMRAHPLPTPKLLLWDPQGDALGTALFVSTFIVGAPLLDAMKAGEPWANALYVDTVCALQSITAADLPPGSVELMTGSVSAIEVLEASATMLGTWDPVADAAFQRLQATWPGSPGDRFSNGDLWPENFLVRGERLAGIIDWQHAGFTDPIFEFLLPFFLVPELRGRGTEAAYCERMGFDAAVLHWYHGLEFLDSLRLVLKAGKPYGIHTAESLTRDLARWLTT